MSRFYDIKVLNTDGSIFREYMSHPNNVYDPNALEVEMDIQIAQHHLIRNIGSYVRVYNIPLQDVAQGVSFNGKQVLVYGGMRAGLPLATAVAQEAGLLAQGVVYNGFGNWQGTVQTLDLYLRPSTGTHEQPIPYVLYWPAKTTLAAALQQCLSTALPSATIKINISPNLINGFDEQHVTGTLQDMAAFVRDASKRIVSKASYAGVSIVMQNNSVVVDDRTNANTSQPNSQQNPKVIQFLDLIAQPTWLDVATISVELAMRGDIGVTDWVKMPPTITTQTNSSLTFARQPNATFSGVYQVIAQRHVAKSRDTSSDGWMTNLHIIADTTETGSSTPNVNSTSNPSSTPGTLPTTGTSGGP